MEQVTTTEIAQINQEIERAPVVKYTTEQINLIRTQIAPRATDAELQIFLYQCNRTGLDALSRQIYAIHRDVWNPQTKKKEPKMTIQTSIDGFRVVAERSKLYAGQSEPEFEYEANGRDIKSCKVRVYKFNPHNYARYEAAVGVAHWQEYAQKTQDGGYMGLWGKMPHVMIAKVAEAVALRKAFPQDLSGLYTTEEISDDVDVNKEYKAPPAAAALPESKPVQKAVEIKKVTPIASITLTEERFENLIKLMQGGDIKAYEAAKAKVSFSADQQKKIDEVIQAIAAPKTAAHA